MTHDTCKTAMILAAGLGTRLKPYTDHTPKALFTIDRQPVLAGAIDRLVEAGFQKLLINTHHHHRQIESFVAENTCAVPVVLQYEPEILGTGGGIRNLAGQWAPGPLLVINADIVTSIDLDAVYRFHCRHPFPVTMVMQDVSEFNTVAVDDGFVTGFKASGDSAAGRGRLAFTGIHVLDRRVLDYLPPSGPAHIIDAYSAMLAAGQKIRAYRARNHYWQDIGTPDHYRETAYTVMAPLAFEKAFGSRPDSTIRRQRLHGDGSDRQWYRLRANGETLILADHGIRRSDKRQEVDAYVDIGRHLQTLNLAVPRIVLYDRCAGIVFLQDLGDRHLQTAIAGLNSGQTRALYEIVIRHWLDMAVRAGQSFDVQWTYQTQRYDRQVVLQNECRYFIEAFVNGHLGWEIRYETIAGEFEWLADRIMRIDTTGFIHRDLQSRNIMIDGKDIRFIDFQGGRLGPLQYDLASLLIDPYVNLPNGLQQQLMAFCTDTLQRQYQIDASEFRSGYAACALSRNLQILGAFAFLSASKGKHQFLTYIPGAVACLRRTLKEFEANQLVGLRDLVRDISAHLSAGTVDQQVGRPCDPPEKVQPHKARRHKGGV